MISSPISLSAFILLYVSYAIPLSNKGSQIFILDTNSLRKGAKGRGRRARGQWKTSCLLFNLLNWFNLFKDNRVMSFKAIWALRSSGAVRSRIGASWSVRFKRVEDRLFLSSFCSFVNTFSCTYNSYSDQVIFRVKYYSVLWLSTEMIWAFAF